MLKHLPNALTLLRLVLTPFIAWAVWLTWDGPSRYSEAASILAAGLFVLAALTDLFDGMAARAFNAHSKFGRLIDPIADKLLVGLPLIVLSIFAVRFGWMFWPVIVASSAVIVLRDLSMTLLRLTAKDGEGAPVSRLAKWKTALELVAVGAPILAGACMGYGLDLGANIVGAWVALLALAAALSAWTGFQYLTPKRS